MFLQSILKRLPFHLLHFMKKQDHFYKLAFYYIKVQRKILLVQILF